MQIALVKKLHVLLQITINAAHEFVCNNDYLKDLIEY